MTLQSILSHVRPWQPNSAATEASPEVVERINALVEEALYGCDPEGALGQIRTGADDTRAFLEGDQLVIEGTPQTDRLAPLWAAFADALGADTEVPRRRSSLTDAAISEEAEFGSAFGELVCEVPGRSFSERGQQRLVDLLEPLPTPPPGLIDALKASPAVEAIGAIGTGSGDLGTVLAEKGLSPLTFLRAGQAVGRMLSRAYRGGKIEAPVEILEDGTLRAGGGLSADAALRAVEGTCEVPAPTAYAVLSWLVIASEETPDLFRGWFAEFYGDYASLEPLPAGQEVPGPLDAWRVDAVNGGY